MQRYERYAEQIIVEPSRKRRYSTMYYPIPERRSTDVFVITRRSDRLDLLANDYYGDPRLWVMIAKANRLHSLVVTPGTHLWIPFPYDQGLIDESFKNKQF